MDHFKESSMSTAARTTKSPRELYNIANIAACGTPHRTDFVFTPNALGLDRDRIEALSYELHQQRMREAGLI
jgi:hypothetical protein